MVDTHLDDDNDRQHGATEHEDPHGWGQWQ